MKNSLKAENIEKNREFDSIVKPYLIINVIITIIMFLIFMMSDIKLFHISKDILLYLGGSLVITVWLLFWTLGDDECPNCAARKYENRLSENLVGESHLGNKVVDTSSSRGARKMGYHGFLDSGPNYEKVAVFKRTYKYNSICKYCDYEWTGEFTRKEEEKL